MLWLELPVDGVSSGMEISQRSTARTAARVGADGHLRIAAEPGARGRRIAHHDFRGIIAKAAAVYRERAAA